MPYICIDSNVKEELDPQQDSTLVLSLSHVAANGNKGVIPVKVDAEKGWETKADFETAIELTGYGKFHYILLAICGLVCKY